jgi:hypothetical protein
MCCPEYTMIQSSAHPSDTAAILPTHLGNIWQGYTAHPWKSMAVPVRWVLQAENYTYLSSVELCSILTFQEFIPDRKPWLLNRKNDDRLSAVGVARFGTRVCISASELFISYYYEKEGCLAPTLTSWSDVTIHDPIVFQDLRINLWMVFHPKTGNTLAFSQFFTACNITRRNSMSAWKILF